MKMQFTQEQEILLNKILERNLEESDRAILAANLADDPDFPIRLVRFLGTDQMLRELYFGQGRSPLAFDEAATDRESLLVRSLDECFETLPSVSPKSDVVTEVPDFDLLIQLANKSKPTSSDNKPESPSTDFSKPKKRRKAFFEMEIPLRYLVVPVLALFFLAVYFEFNPRKPREASVTTTEMHGPFAEITAVIYPIFPEDGPVFEEGRSLGEDKISISSGLLEMKFRSGVRLVLDGDTCMSLHSPMKVFCEKGRISVEVPKGAEGFEVVTPLMNVKDLGTKFVVDVSEDKSIVHVVQGMVEADCLSGEKIQVLDGFGMIANSTNSFRRILADKSLFIDGERIREEAALYREKLRIETERKRWRNDPDLLLGLGMENDGTKAELIDDILGKGKAWRTGYRKNTQAYMRDKVASDYAEGDDLLFLSVPEEYVSMTGIIVLHVHSLKNNGIIFREHDIFFGNPNSPGAFMWVLRQDGGLAFALRADKPKPENLTSGFNVDNVVMPPDFNVKTMLAFTMDGESKRMTFYKNGKAIAQNPWIGPVPLKMEKSVLASNPFEDQNCLDADIERVMLFGRALTEEEIADVYGNFL